MNRILLLSLFCGAVTLNAAAAEVKPKPAAIVPEKQHGFIAKQVLYYIEHYNYKKITVNDSISSVFLDQLLKTLDPEHSLFKAEDLKGFEQYRNRLDDDFRKGDVSSVFAIYTVYDQRFRAWIDASLLKLKNSKPENPKIGSGSLMPSAGKTENWYKELLSQHEEQNAATVFQLIMDAFTKVIDPHTSYFNPAAAMAMEEQFSRTVEGIGAAMLSEDGLIKITDVLAGGPAYRSGQVHAGDRITGVAQEDGQFQSVAGWRVEKALKLIKGAKGSKVRLQLLRSGQPAGSNPVVVELVRDKIVLEEQSAKKTLRKITRNGKTYTIGVIYIPAFYADEKEQQAGNPNYKSTTRDVWLIIDTLKNIDKADGIVIDLRGNGGGSLQEAIELTGLFIDKGPVVQMRYNNQKLAIGTDSKPGMAWDGPLAVMVNRTSASASEIFSAAMQDYQRAIIMGSKTYGKGTAQRGLDLNSVTQPDTLKTLLNPEQQKTAGFILQLGELSLTYAKFYRISGTTTQLVGVKPDIDFPSVYADTEIGESSYASALTADSIKALPFEKFRTAPFPIAELTSAHQKRMKSSYQFDLLQLEIDHRKENAAAAKVTGKKINLKTDTDYLRKVNRIRKVNGLQVLTSAQSADPLPKDDFMMQEGAGVLVDLINITP